MDGGIYDHATLEVNEPVLHAKYDERFRMDFTMKDAGRLSGHVIRTVEVWATQVAKCSGMAQHKRHFQIHVGKTASSVDGE